jgi:hypothetical protein
VSPVVIVVPVVVSVPPVVSPVVVMSVVEVLVLVSPFVVVPLSVPVVGSAVVGIDVVDDVLVGICVVTSPLLPLLLDALSVWATLSPPHATSEVVRQANGSARDSARGRGRNAADIAPLIGPGGARGQPPRKPSTSSTAAQPFAPQ